MKQTYLAFRDWNLTDYGNTLEGAQFKVEVVADSEIAVPSFMYSREYEGQPVYSDSTVFVTSEYVGKSFIIQGGSEYCQGVMKQRTYGHDGRLLRVIDRSALIPRIESTSLGAYVVRPIFGTTEIAIYDIVNDVLGGDVPTISIDIPASTDLTLARWSYAGGWYWFPAVGGIYAINGDDIVFVVIPGVNYTTMFVAADPITGRTYVRYSSTELYIGEISAYSGSVLWVTLLEGRVFVHILSTARVYDVSGESAELLGSLPAPSEKSAAFPYAPGFAIAAGNVYQFSDRENSSPADLAEVIGMELDLSCLLSAADIDVTQISGSVKGYQISGDSIRSAIEPLATAFQFDVIQSGYKIKFVPRGSASVLTVPYEDLGATTGDTPDKVFSQSREMDTQLPAKTTVSYLDAEREYEVSEQSASRINTEAVNEEDVELAIVIGADGAAGIAEMLQTRAWLERTNMSFTIPPTYLNLEPTDVITVDAKSAIHEVFIQEIDYRRPT